MICKFGARILLLAFGIQLLSSPLQAADNSTASKATNATNSVELKPGPDAGQVAYVTALMLERWQYLRHPFDATISGRLFDGYLTSLDPAHMHFLQSDLDDFSAYRTNLNRMTLNRRGIADTTPAYEIFYRYMERFRQHVAYVDEALKTEKFEFTADDKITVNRHDSPYPKTLDEAKQLWRERLRYEYLMEKISRETQKAKAQVSAARGDSGKGDTNNVLSTPEKPAGPPKTMHEEITETLSKNYHRSLRYAQERDSSDVLNDYLEWLARSYDPHSDYQGPADYEDFAMQMNLSLFGIGAVLMAKDGYCQIEELMNGPAKLSNKIKVNDRIVAVAQSNQPPVDIIDMPLNKAVRLIRGPKGTEVRLTIIPAGGPESAREFVTLTRDEIKLENGEAKGKIIEVPDHSGGTARLGIIDLPSFYATIDANGNPTPKSTSADVEKLLKKFNEQKVSGVILDLRRNGGGSLEEAIKLAGLFIKEGPVVQIKRWDGEIEVREDTDPSIAYSGPLILLTSKFSASASEIVAGALQDYGRALIVGDTTTFGKGTAQQLFYLSKIPALSSLSKDPGTLKLTNSKFYRASGASTELRGVAADIVLPSLWNDSTEVGENTLENHLPWDTIESSTYEKVNMVQPFLSQLSRRSNDRVTTNKEFAYLREDIARVQKQRAEKTLSLNEKQELSERAGIIAGHKEREQERAAHKAAAEPTVYDFTVAQAGKPGLPAATPHTNSVASTRDDLGMDPTVDPTADRDELTEAASSENDHAEAARMQEAENILTDYISLWKDAGKQNSPMLAR
jgi:carboxyl-terminal processing protease